MGERPTGIEREPGQWPLQEYREISQEVLSVANNRPGARHIPMVDSLYRMGLDQDLSDFIHEREHHIGHGAVALYAVMQLWDLDYRPDAREHLGEVITMIERERGPDQADHRVMQAALDFQAYTERHPDHAEWDADRD